MNIYEELEKKEYGFKRYDDGKEIKRVFEIEEIKRAISSAREELLKDSFCMNSSKAYHICNGHNCAYVVGVSKIILCLGDGE